MGKTAAERKAAERERRSEQGLQRFETWLTEDEWTKVRRYIERHILPKRKSVNQEAKS